MSFGQGNGFYLASAQPNVARNLEDRFPHPYTRPDADRWLASVAEQDPATQFAITADDELILIEVNAYMRQGRLEEAASALQQAAGSDPPAPAWTLAWYSALVDKEYGNLDQAIATLEEIAATRFHDARKRGFDFSKDTRVLNELGRIYYDRARQARGDTGKTARTGYLEQARGWLRRVLEIDPENARAHYSLTLVEAGLGQKAAAEYHRTLHDRYRPDDHAVEQAVTRHRRLNPAADHAAEAIAVLEREGDNYSAAIRHQRAFVDDPASTLSARIVRELEQSGSSFFEFALATARCHRDYFASIAPLGKAREAVLADEAEASLHRQADIEAADEISLDEYLQRYFEAF